MALAAVLIVPLSITVMFVYGILAVRGRFEHLYRSSNGSGGFGLGLSICKDLVERIGGEISIPSEGGSGTLVEITPPQDGTPRKGGK